MRIISLLVSYGDGPLVQISVASPRYSFHVAYHQMDWSQRPKRRVIQTWGGALHAARRMRAEFAACVLVNAASLFTENSSLRTATLTCARQCAPSSVHRICCFFAMRWLTTRFTADSAMLLLIGSPLR